MKVVICGGGISGLTLAYHLRRLGHEPLIIEQAGSLRSGGYMIDFFGPGFDAAERLGLLPALRDIHYPIAQLTFLDGEGRDRFSLPYEILRKRLFSDRHFNFMRGDLERVLYGHIKGRVPVRFGTTVKAFEQHDDRVHVVLSDNSSEECDLLVGSDGVHSRTRALQFGDPCQFERFLPFHTAAFILEKAPEALPARDAFETLSVPNRQIAVYPIRGGRLATFLVYPAERPIEDRSHENAVRELRRVYGDLGWIVPELLHAAEENSSLYFDDILQIEMPHWSSGRVVLLGDACQCMSLVAGQGASMAMEAAYILAEELNSGAPLEQALRRYQQRLRPGIQEKQKAARKMAAWFTPPDGFRLLMRDLALKLSLYPVTSSFVRHSIAGSSVFRRRG